MSPRIILLCAALPMLASADYPKTVLYDGMPPPRLRVQSSEVVRVVFGHVERCGDTGIPGKVFEACTRDGWVLYLPNPCDYGDKEEFARLTCHELAHSQGWPKDHGD